MEYTWLTAAINIGTFFKTSLLKLNAGCTKKITRIFFSTRSSIRLQRVLQIKHCLFGELVLKGKNIVGEHNGFEKFTLTSRAVLNKHICSSAIDW